MKTVLTILAIFLTAFGLVALLFKLALLVGWYSVYFIVSGISCVVLLAAVEIFEKSK